MSVVEKLVGLGGAGAERREKGREKRRSGREHTFTGRILMVTKITGAKTRANKSGHGPS